MDTTLASPPSRRSAGVTWIGRFVFRYRDYLAPLGLVFILAASRPQPFFRSARWDLWFDALGLLIAVCGQAVRVLVIGYAYIQRGGVNKQLAAGRLVSEGVYAHSRNPMYVGNFLLLTGLAIIYHAPLVYFVALPVYIIALVTIITSEEQFLRAKFGHDYDVYCEQVPRFLPQLRGLRMTLAGMRFDWRRVIRKEYGTTFAWVSVAVLLIAWEHVDWYGASGAARCLKWLSALWLGVFVLYAIARWLKKTRRLG